MRLRLGLLPLLLLPLAACGSTGVTASPTPSPAAPSIAPSPSAAPSAPPSAAASPVPSPSATAAVAGAACTAERMRVTAGTQDAAAGHRSLVLVFLNQGPECTVSGYPAVTAANAGGQPLASAQQTPTGFMGGAPVARLLVRNGDSVSVVVEATAATGSGASCSAHRYAKLVVRVGGAQVSLGWNGDGCAGLQVHPFVAGTSGRK